MINVPSSPGRVHPCRPVRSVTVGVASLHLWRGDEVRSRLGYTPVVSSLFHSRSLSVPATCRTVVAYTPCLLLPRRPRPAEALFSCRRVQDVSSSQVLSRPPSSYRGTGSGASDEGSDSPS